MTSLMGSDGAGFNFDLAKRNHLLEQKGMKSPVARKTGTTLAGCVFKDGVVLGSDTRATAGDIVADKNCQKLHVMAPNIYCAGSGTSADCDQVTQMVSSALTLHRYETGRQSRVITALTMLKTHLRKYQGYVSAALILGGVDLNGPHLFTVFPHGSTDALPFCTMGSGCLNSMSVLESGYKDGMSEEAAKKLVARAIQAGVYNDSASGSNVDLVVITKDGVKMHRPYEYLMDKTYQRKKPVRFAPGTAPVLKERIISLKELTITEGDDMDTT